MMFSSDFCKENSQVYLRPQQVLHRHAQARQVITPQDEALGPSVISGGLQYNVLLLSVLQAVYSFLLHLALQRGVMLLV